MSNLIVAEAYGLPFLPPYKNITKSQDDVKKGVNFAYGGATALDVNYFKGGRVINSLNMQFDWFKKLKPSLCKTKEGFVLTPCILFLFEINCFSCTWLTKHLFCCEFTECDSFFKK